MCGIVALWRAGTPETVALMLDAIVHRGPDDAGTVAAGSASLGVRRLAIIDVPGGHQPLANEDATVWVAFNGEIYNHAELRLQLAGQGHRFRTATDTEVLVHGYEAWGAEGLLARLRGMFAFALADTGRHECILARDRLGKKPLYLARVGGGTSAGWAAASEIKALFRHPALAPDLDETRIPESLANRFVTGEGTIFANVRRLAPGCWMRLTEGGADVHRYWSPPAAEGGAGPADIPARVRTLVDDAVRARLVADVPLGALLSGGLDSSVVVAAMRHAGADPLRTYTVGFADTASDERAAARRVAAHFGTVHTEREVALDAAAVLGDVVWHADEPLADAAAAPTLLICRTAREHVTVVLSGEGADELFLGYPRYLLSRLADRALALPERLRKPLFGAAAQLLPGRWRSGLARLADASADPLLRNAIWMSGTDAATIGALCRRSPVNSRRWFVPEDEAPPPPDARGLAAVLRRDLSAWLVDDVLLKLDKMSMAASLEARAPFLDVALVEFVCRLPVEVRFAARGKRWLREAFGAALPAATAARSKRPFRPPVAAWLRGQLGLKLEAAIGQHGSFTQQFLDVGVARALLDEHRRGRDHALLLWSLLVHETWWRRFFTGTPEAA